MTNEKCEYCTKDWTKCGMCPVTMQTNINNRIKYLTTMRKTYQAFPKYLSIAIETLQNYQISED